MRSRVPPALDALSALQVRLEQRFQDTGSYAGAPGVCGATNPTIANFTVTCALNGTNGFTATATGTGPMAGYTYTVNQAGTRATTAHPKGANTTCWTTKGTTCDS
ncbi:type IV pilin protein [Aquincola sp. J276]|nr:type IV pilin protein [Aquincola sp. J276]